MADTSPVVAQLIGHDKVAVTGDLIVQSYTPIFALCRKLIERGMDPQRHLQAYRGDTLCLTVPIGEGARLTVHDDAMGKPRFRPYRDPDDAKNAANAPAGLLHNHRGPLKATEAAP